MDGRLHIWQLIMVRGGLVGGGRGGCSIKGLTRGLKGAGRRGGADGGL